MSGRTPPLDLLGLIAATALLGALNVGWAEPRPVFGAIYLGAAAGLMVRLLLDLGGKDGSPEARR